MNDLNYELNMSHSVLIYQNTNNTFNVGDYIQSIAASHFLPEINHYINREELGAYKGEKTKLIMNGWFTHEPKTWVPSSDISPLFISFHINSQAKNDILSIAGIQYLKLHEPIGCRDHNTTNMLIDKGIDAYFSGCLTLTLDHYKVDDDQRNDSIYIVDPLFNYPSKKKCMENFKSFRRHIKNGSIFKINQVKNILEKNFNSEILKSAEYIEHELPANNFSEEQKFQLADELLNKYARAKLVITSRIHCALPCLALGTPVIFIDGFDHINDTCRFDGVTNLFNKIKINRNTKILEKNFKTNSTGQIDLNTIPNNPQTHLKLIDHLKTECQNFITN